MYVRKGMNYKKESTEIVEPYAKKMSYKCFLVVTLIKTSMDILRQYNKGVFELYRYN